MAQKAEFVQLEADDDVTSVRDRLSRLRGKRVLLIWPESGSVLTRKLDLVLIQREVMRLAIRLALVTHEPDIIKQANELNISTFETVGASERGRWKRGRSKVFTNRSQRPPADSPAEVAQPVTSRVYSDDDDEAPRRFGLMRLLVTVLLLAVVLGTAYVLLPSATVQIVPAQERVQVEAVMTADTEATAVSIDTGIIPAVTLRVEIEETGTIPTTGTQSLSDVAAVGSVVFINQTNNTVEVPADTVLSTSAGTPILFRTTAAATVPGEVGAQIEVPIEALPGSVGAVGNVETGLINAVVGDIGQQVTVRNLAPTYGGESRTLSAVTEADYDRLLATLRQQLQSRAYLGMEAQITDGQTIILETIRLSEEREDWKTWSAEPGDIADTLSLTMRARVEATVIDERFAREVAFGLLNREVPPGRELVRESLMYRCCTVLSIDGPNRVTFSSTVEGVIVSQVDVAQLQNRLAGQSLTEARDYLNNAIDLAPNTEPQIIVSPDWFGQMPLFALRIQVDVVNLDV